jgi:hypothetical protein
MRLPIAHYLFRSPSSPILDVCQHIRLRSTPQSRLISNTLLEASKTWGGTRQRAICCVIAPRLPRSRHRRDLRFPQDSGLASNALLTADRSGLFKCGVFYFVIPPRQSSRTSSCTLRFPRQSPSTKLGTVSLSNRSLVSPRPCSGPEPVERLAYSERPVRVAHLSAVLCTFPDTPACHANGVITPIP